jgi:hypothetical protein
MLFDTTETILKTECLNENQKSQIKTKLLDSKYSRLDYNKSIGQIASKKIESRNINSPAFSIITTDNSSDDDNYDADDDDAIYDYETQDEILNDQLKKSDGSKKKTPHSSSLLNKE